LTVLAMHVVVAAFLQCAAVDSGDKLWPHARLVHCRCASFRSVQQMALLCDDGTLMTSHRRVSEGMRMIDTRIGYSINNIAAQAALTS